MNRYLRKLAVCHWHYLSLDHMQLPLALGFKVVPGVTVSGLLFRPSGHYGALGGPRSGIRERVRDVRKRWAYDRMLRHRAMAAVFTLDPLFPGFAAAHFRAGWKVRAVPDPAPVDDVSAGAARGRDQVGSIPEGRVCFLLFGALSERKGVLQTLEAMTRLEPAVLERIALVFAGQVDRGIRAAFCDRLRWVRATRPEAWIDVRDRFIEEDELAALVARSDVVLAPYQRFVGSSGVLVWAATARRPTITQDYGLVGALTRQYGLGYVVDTRNPEAIAEAMAKAARDPQRRLQNETAVQAFLAGRTPQAFAESIFRGLAELGHAG
ncbi:MAG TPA: glycosyltransferase [Gemmatimonadales bacterium]|nr:glycosyltransferase [Gemmatimonadales bacterium]